MDCAGVEDEPNVDEGAGVAGRVPLLLLLPAPDVVAAPKNPPGACGGPPDDVPFKPIVGVCSAVLLFPVGTGFPNMNGVPGPPLAVVLDDSDPLVVNGPGAVVAVDVDSDDDAPFFAPIVVDSPEEPPVVPTDELAPNVNEPLGFGVDVGVDVDVEVMPVLGLVLLNASLLPLLAG